MRVSRATVGPSSLRFRRHRNSIFLGLKQAHELRRPAILGRLEFGRGIGRFCAVSSQHCARPSCVPRNRAKTAACQHRRTLPRVAQARNRPAHIPPPDTDMQVAENFRRSADRYSRWIRAAYQRCQAGSRARWTVSRTLSERPCFLSANIANRVCRPGVCFLCSECLSPMATLPDRRASERRHATRIVGGTTGRIGRQKAGGEKTPRRAGTVAWAGIHLSRIHKAGRFRPGRWISRLNSKIGTSGDPRNEARRRGREHGESRQNGRCRGSGHLRGWTGILKASPHQGLV